jgi:hypothetical protein
MGTVGPFPRSKARPGRDADHSPPSSAEVKYEQELYLLSPHVPPWRVAGQLYFFYNYVHIFLYRLKSPHNIDIFSNFLNKKIKIITFLYILLFCFIDGTLICG